MSKMTNEILDAVMSGMTEHGIKATRIDVSLNTDTAIRLEALLRQDPLVKDDVQYVLFGVPVVVQETLAARFRVIFAVPSERPQ